MKAQANNGSVKFAAASSAARQEIANLPLDNQLEEDGGDLKTLEGYFGNLAAAAVNKQGFLKQLVLNNTTLATSNKILVALIKKQNNDIKNLEREIARLKKVGQSSASNTTLCGNCKKEDFHQPQDYFERIKNKDTRLPGWRSSF